MGREGEKRAVGLRVGGMYLGEIFLPGGRKLCLSFLQ